jgi:hypothetical protein
MFLFLLVDFKFENWSFEEWRLRGLKGIRFGKGEVELVICKIWSKYD